MHLAVLTSVETRHRYFARTLHASVPVGAVLYERTGYSPAAVPELDELDEQERSIVERHYEDRAAAEERMLGRDAEFLTETDGTAVLHLDPGTLNSQATFRFLREAGVAGLIVYGTNLVRDPILAAYSGRILNMHLGLSPYYRGTATNFYPLLNGEPEYVGATIHLIDAGIDSGPIVSHARPEISVGDRPHDIGCKAIAAGTAKMTAAARRLLNGTLTSVPQWNSAPSHLYLRKDFHPRQVVDLYRSLDEGLIEQYLARRAAGGAEVSLID